MRKLTYPVVLLLLILAFILSMLQVIKNKTDPDLSIGILISLLALVIFKNRKAKLRQSTLLQMLVALAGSALSFLQTEVALAYAMVGLGLLVVTQIRIMKKSKTAWLVIDGNPLHKLEGEDAKYASLGLSMLLSVAVTFFLKVVWLSSTL